MVEDGRALELLTPLLVVRVVAVVAVRATWFVVVSGLCEFRRSSLVPRRRVVLLPLLDGQVGDAFMIKQNNTLSGLLVI